MKTDTAWSAEARGRIEQALEQVFAALPATEVARAARYAVQGGGHRWRGLLAVAAGLGLALAPIGQMTARQQFAVQVR